MFSGSIFGLPAWLFWYLLSQYAGLTIGIMYYVYRSKFKIGYRAVFVSKKAGTWTKVGERTYDPTADSVRFKNQTFILSGTRILFREHGWYHTFFSFEEPEAKSLDFSGSHTIADPKIVDLFVNSGVIRQIVARLSGLDKQAMIMLVVISVAIGAACFMGGIFAYPLIFR